MMKNLNDATSQNVLLPNRLVEVTRNQNKSDENDWWVMEKYRICLEYKRVMLK